MTQSFRERRKGDVCSCGHHMDQHVDGWASCGPEDRFVCDCEEYDGPITRWDEAIDGPSPLLALIKKDTAFAHNNRGR